MGDDKKPVKGDMHIDASGLATKDLTPDYIGSLTKLRSGHDLATKNLKRLSLEQMKAAGLNPEEVTETLKLAEKHEELVTYHEASEKMTEVLHDTKMDKGHELAIRLAELASQATRRAERVQNGAEILGPLSDLLEYQYGPAQRAAATKAKAKPAPKGHRAEGADDAKKS